MADQLKELTDLIDANERNIYILSGVFGATLAILSIIAIVILIQNNKLKSQIRKLQQDLPWARGPAPAPPQMPRAAPSKAGSIYSANTYGDQRRY
ncbi:unnamed protein product [Allacma fusca]|uniref:Uncharacterized protein n=1 Tax=Allacma fusca TaxID=39272 RepID=A0A8J2LU85_9HEXA|nr:unnamed protein product [Allacma fusca]